VELILSIKTLITNIFLGLIPSSKKRKELRKKLNSIHNIKKINFLESRKNIINNNSIIVINRNNKKFYNCKIRGLNINFVGKNSCVTIHEPFSFNSCSFKIGNNSNIEIMPSQHEIANLYITATNESEIFIGENFSCRGCCIENHDEKNLKVNIGNDCMFSYGIRLRVSDGHSIYYLNTKQTINNPQRGIIIGNHVWIGLNSTILKDTNIADNSIIGAHSLVNKSFYDRNVIIAGNPAKIIKREVNWCRENTNNFNL